MAILITPEWPYCAYPLVVEIYNFCDHGCLYCFTRHKETWHNKARKRRNRGFDEKLDIQELDVIRNIFRGYASQALGGKVLEQFFKQRCAIQVGAQTDPCGRYEHKYKRTLEFLRLLRDEGESYPVRISTKGVAFKKPEYLDVLRDYRNASILISMCSTNADLIRQIEPFAPTIEERFSLGNALSKTKVRLGLRMRPIIPGVPDKVVEDLVKRAKDNGFQWITVDWLRIPRTLTSETTTNIEAMSRAVGLDLVSYYRKHADTRDNRNAQLRLKAEATIDLYEKIYALCQKHEIALSSCNKDYRCHGTYSPNCCGVPLSDESWNRMQFSYAVYIAREKGLVSWHDVYDSNSPLNAVRNRDNDSKIYYGLSYGDSLKEIWNNARHRFYPATFFPELVFSGIDSSGNHVFSYKGLEERAC
jgi:DNA repair photolyase